MVRKVSRHNISVVVDLWKKVKLVVFCLVENLGFVQLKKVCYTFFWYQQLNKEVIHQKRSSNTKTKGNGRLNLEKISKVKSKNKPRGLALPLTSLQDIVIWVGNSHFLHWNFDCKSCFVVFFLSETSEKIHTSTSQVKI